MRSRLIIIDQLEVEANCLRDACYTGKKLRFPVFIIHKKFGVFLKFSSSHMLYGLSICGKYQEI